MMVTDTVLKKSTIENVFFKKVVSGASNHWPYYTGLLVLCVKFRLPSVFSYFFNTPENFSYICNIYNIYRERVYKYIYTYRIYIYINMYI